MAMPEDTYVLSALQASEIAKSVNVRSTLAESEGGGY